MLWWEFGAVYLPVKLIPAMPITIGFSYLFNAAAGRGTHDKRDALSFGSSSGRKLSIWVEDALHTDRSDEYR